MIARVTVLFGINSTNNAIKISRGKPECYFNSFASATDPKLYHSLIVGLFFLIICSVATTICAFQVYLSQILPDGSLSNLLKKNSVACSINIESHAYQCYYSY